MAGKKTPAPGLDKPLEEIQAALKSYARSHTRAKIKAYRQNSVSVRVRIIDPDFHGQSRAQREEDVWASLSPLPDEVAAEISLLLLLTPAEAKASFASAEFDNPVPSRI